MHKAINLRFHCQIVEGVRRQVVLPPGEARSDLWQIMEFAKHFSLSEVWGPQLIPGLEAEGFEKKSALLNEGAKTKKQQELQKKFMELQKEAAESQMELQKRERELTKPIIDELRGVIESIGKEKGLTLILERNEGAVLFSQGEEDLTEQVIEKFNSSSKRVGKKNN